MTKFAETGYVSDVETTTRFRPVRSRKYRSDPLQVKELKPACHDQGSEFINWALEGQYENADFGDKITLSDKVHFYLDGFVNTQNCRI